jgi:cystathionine beta-lyase/cystathionine gamma-synthase
VVDENVYHETRHLLLTGNLRDRIEVVRSDVLADRVDAVDAAVVFVDAVSNTCDVRVADLQRLADGARRDNPERLLVVDTSVCSMRASMVRTVLHRSDSRLVLIESLTKHAQLGLDRVSAGVVVAGSRDADVLDGLREHLGTNIADVACLLLPAPDGRALDERLARIGRNAKVVAAALEAAGVPVRHPSRASHPDHARWRALGPTAAVLTVPVDAPLEQWLRDAATQEVPLHHGAGFGFDVTRVYRTSRTVPEATEFVRIAPGTEPIDAIDAVAQVLSSSPAPSAAPARTTSSAASTRV